MRKSYLSLVRLCVKMGHVMSAGNWGHRNGGGGGWYREAVLCAMLGFRASQRAQHVGASEAGLKTWSEGFTRNLVPVHLILLAAGGWVGM